MKACYTVFLLLLFNFCDAQNVGIGTSTPLHKLDINGNLGFFGRQAISDNNDNYLRLNQNANYSSGIYSPGALRVDGGFISGPFGPQGPGTIVATNNMRCPLYYDLNNTSYYLAPALTSNLNILRFNNIDCLNGTCPTNGVIRYTPNFHLNTPAGYAMIVNWDNGATAANNYQFRVGNGQGSDVFDVSASGQVTAYGAVNAPNLNINANSAIGISSINSLSGNTDGEAVYGKSINNPGFGKGGYFEGGYIGVNAVSTTTNYTGSGFGVYGLATGSAGSRYGVYGIASASAGTSSGYGIFGTASGAATNYGVYCNGNGTYTGTWVSASDQKLKTDIRDYSGALKKIIQLSPKTYLFRTQEYSYMNLPEGEQIGLIAQEVQKVFPQLVQNTMHPGDVQDKKQVKNTSIAFKSMNYIGLTPILVEAIKEQQQIIDDQQHQISGMKSDIESMHRELEMLKQKIK